VEKSVVTLVHERVMVVVVDKEALAHFVSLGADWFVSGPAPLLPLSRTLFEPSCSAPHLARTYHSMVPEGFNDKRYLRSPSSLARHSPVPRHALFLVQHHHVNILILSIHRTHIILSSSYTHAVHPYTALTVWSCPRLFPQASRIWLAAASSSIFHGV
jgi:hypothetical protein